MTWRNAVLCFLGLAFILGSSAWLRTGDPLADGFLFQDRAHMLHLADVLASGGRLYRDVFFNYGPIPAYAYYYWTLLAGNSALSYVAWFWASGFCFYLVQLRWVQRTGWRGILVLLLTIPVVVRFASYTPYLFIEGILASLIALRWRPPGERGTRTSAVVGLLLGLMQLNKFGTAALVGFCWLLLDLSWAWQHGAAGDVRRRWFQELLVQGGAFLLVQLLFAAWLWSMLPGWLALNTFWPTYIVRWYESYLSPEYRYPDWFGWNFFVGEQLALVMLALAGACLVAGWLGRRLRSSSTADVTDAGGVLLALVYTLAFFTLLKHKYLQTSYVWMFIPALICLAQKVSLRNFAVLAAPLAIPFLLHGRQMLRGPLPLERMATRLPNGETLYLEPSVVQRVRRLQELTDEMKRRLPGGRFLVCELGSGLSYFLQLPPLTRHSWPAPGVIMPQDEPNIVKNLDRLAGVVLISRRGVPLTLGVHPRTWVELVKTGGTVPVFSPETAEAVAARLGRMEQIDRDCWVIFPREAKP